MVAKTPKGNAVLRLGQGVFVSVSSGLPSGLLNTVLRVCPDVGLVPFVYQGLRQLSGRTTTSVHNEASEDLANSSALFIVLPLDISASLDDWILGRLSCLLNNGFPIRVYLFGVRSVAETTNATQLGQHFTDIPTKHVADLAGFEIAFRDDLFDFLDGSKMIQ
jgi:hypothetical protein